MMKKRNTLKQIIYTLSPPDYLPYKHIHRELKKTVTKFTRIALFKIYTAL